MQRLVIIPTYNEKENIEAIITAVMDLPLDFHVLIIDDGSPDGTAAIVKRLIEGRYKDRLHLVERSGKLGLGTGAQSRLYLRDGCRLQPQPAGPAQAP